MSLVVKFNHPVCICSPRNSGKTAMAKYWIHALSGTYDFLLIFSNPSALTQYRYLETDKTVKLYDHLDTEKIAECFRINEARITKNQKPVNFLLLFDDSLDRDSKYNNELNRCFQWGRINKICPIVLQQNIKLVNPTIRNNSDYFICFRVRTESEKNYVYENLLNACCKNKKEAYSVINNLEPYQAIVASWIDGKTNVVLFTAPLINHK